MTDTTVPQPMSRRDVWLTIALAVAKGDIPEPQEMITYPGRAWISYAGREGQTYAHAQRAVDHFGLTERTGQSASGVCRWFSPGERTFDVSVWWHPDDAPPVEPSPLADQVVAAIEATS